MDEQAVAGAEFMMVLADRLQIGLRFNVASRPADLRDRNIRLIILNFADRTLDLVRDMRNDLNGLAQIPPRPFTRDHAAVNASSRVIAVLIARYPGKPLVMAEVQIGLPSVFGDIHLSMLVRRHRSWIDIQIGVQFLHADAVSALLEQQANRGRRQTLTERRHDTARHKDMLTTHGSLLWEMNRSVYKRTFSS